MNSPSKLVALALSANALVGPMSRSSSTFLTFASKALLAGSLLALAGTGNAQEWVGFSDNTMWGPTDRGTLGTAAGELVVRLDAREHGGWGTDLGARKRAVGGIRLVLADLDPNTPETVSVTLHNEIAPGVPNPVGVLLWGSGPILGGPSMYSVSLPPCAAVVVPLTFGGHLFVSIHVPANAAWPLDGIEVGLVDGGAVVDAPGPGYGTRRHNLQRIGIGPYTVQLTATHYFVDVKHGGPSPQCTYLVGGVGGTKTNQAAYPSSNLAPGTSNFLSGSFPDVTRGDCACMTVKSGGLGPFNLVAFLISFGPIVPFAAELPLGSIYVGSTGALCLPSIDVGAVAMTDTVGYADVCYPLPPSALGLSLTHQAVVITGDFHAGPCDHQQM